MTVIHFERLPAPRPALESKIMKTHGLSPSASRIRAAALAGGILFTLSTAVFAASSLRFHGNGTGDVDRVKIAVDDPSNANAGPAADVGAGDFTIEFWMTAAAADDTAGPVSCGANTAWRSGNIVVDRDRSGADRKFGVSIAGGKVVFGVSGDGTGDLTICGARNVLDARWHHVAVQRRRSDGWMWLFVDGALEAEADGPDGDVSYPDDATPAAPNDPYLVLGAEKHDTGPAFPSFSGSLDEIRISASLRYAGGFTRPNVPFAADADTAALYHLDEGSGDAVGDGADAAGGPSDGVRHFGGSPAGPEWTSASAPLGGAPAIMFTPLPGSVSSPMQVANAGDGSGRLFVVEQAGTIHLYKNGALLATPFLDIHTLVTCCGEQGLLSMAFHPDYATNGYFYVYYINKLATPGDITIARYSVSAGDPDVADPNSAQILLVIPHPTNSNHNGGQLFFGPADGYLYIGTGDGGGGGDVPNNAQNLGILLGKMLRIDVNGTGAVPCAQSTPAPYAIPPSNPWAGSATNCREIWAYGVRNPWRFSFDRLTHDLLIGDVGQNAYEEIDFQLAASTGGENYGWRKMEGFHCYNPSTNCDDGTLTLPILEHSHMDGWCAIIGGFRYRGTVMPALDGYYLYSDNCLGDVYGATEAGNGSWSTALLEASGQPISGFGEDEAGEVYFASLSGKIYRVDPSPYPAPVASSLAPASVIAGGSDFVLAVNGSGFAYGSVVRWNGQDRPTTLVSGTTLTAAIAAADIAAAGSAAVTVFTPAPGGGHVDGLEPSTSTRPSWTSRPPISPGSTSPRSSRRASRPAAAPSFIVRTPRRAAPRWPSSSSRRARGRATSRRPAPARSSTTSLAPEAPSTPGSRTSPAGESPEGAAVTITVRPRRSRGRRWPFFSSRPARAPATRRLHAPERSSTTCRAPEGSSTRGSRTLRGAASPVDAATGTTARRPRSRARRWLFSSRRRSTCHLP